MNSVDFQASFHQACSELGLDPANTNVFALECHRQGVDPKGVSAYDLDKNASDMWASFRKLKRAG